MERLLLPLLVWISVGLYLTEVALGTADSRHGPIAFLWAERVIATVFMVEWLVRRGKLTLLGWIDFIAWFPFLVGFFVPTAWLGTIRALRILRLLKLFRYSTSMRSVARAFHRAWPRLCPLVMCLGIIGLFNTVIMTEVEGWSLGDSAWYVLVSATTVGYGDLSPGTPTGKLLAAFTLLVPTLALYAGMLGIIGSSLSESCN